MRYSIFGYYGQGNTGDEAILRSLVDGMRGFSKSVEISVYSDAPDQTESNFDVQSYRFFPLNILKLLMCIRSRNRKHFISSIVNFIRSDVIIIGGGGLFFDSPETNKWMKGYLKLIGLSRFLGKSVAVVGVSLGPLHHESSYNLVRKSFNKLNLISVRDKDSKQILLDSGIAETRISLVPDLVFTMKSVSLDRLREILIIESLGVNDNIVVMTPCVYNLGLNGWIEQYSALCDYIVKRFRAEIWLVPMQQSVDNNDLEAIEKIYEHVSVQQKIKVKIVKGKYQPSEVQALIGCAAFVFAERLHGTIMAVNENKYFMSLAYMPKVSSILNDMGRKDLEIEMSDFLCGRYLRRLDSKINEAFRSENETFNSGDIRVRARENFDLLEQI